VALCMPCSCLITKNYRLQIRERYSLMALGGGCGCLDNDCLAHCCCGLCALVQEKRTLDYYENDKGWKYLDPSTGGPGGPPPGAVTANPEPEETDKKGKKGKKGKKKFEGKAYGDLPPHHPSAQQAYSISKRDAIEKDEKEEAKEEASRKVDRADEWFNYNHDKKFPEVGKKICFKSMWRKYLDANKKNVSCDNGAPAWWEVYQDTEKSDLAVVLKRKNKALRGEGQDAKVLGHPCADEWKAVLKAPGKYLLVNEEGRFLKPDKDGSVSMAPCEVDDPIMVKPFIWEVKTK